MSKPQSSAAMPAAGSRSGQSMRLTALLFVALVMIFSGVGPAAANPDTYPAEVTITRVTPSVLTTGDEVILRVEVENTGDEPLESISLGIHLSPARLESAEDIEAWVSAPPANTSSHEIDAQAIEEPIEPGENRRVNVTLTREEFGAQLSDAGVRGIGIEVVARRGENGARIRQGMDRTVIPWWTERTAHPLAVIAPLTGPLTSPDDEEHELTVMEEATAPSSDLVNAVTALEDVEWLTPAVELSVVARAQESGPWGQLWATRLQDATASRPTIFLPTYDVDLAVVSQDPRGVDLLTRPGIDTTFTVAQSVTTIAVAAPGPVTEGMITTATTAGFQHIVAPAVPGDEEPPATWALSDDGDALVVHHGDPHMTALFTTARNGQDEVADTQAELAQSLLTVIGREEGAAVLVNLERDWMSSAETVTNAATQVEAMPWFEPMAAPELLALRTPEVTSAQPVAESPEMLPVDRLQTLLQAVESVEYTSRITTDPQVITTGFRPKVLAPLAVRARQEPVRQAQLIQFATREAATLNDPIQLLPGSVVNLISQSGELPVQLTNTLEVDAEVMVILRPDHARLIAHPSPSVIVPAGGSATALVPVDAVGSGNVEVTVMIADAQGSVISVAETMTVRVRADWETVGTAVIGAILLLGLIFGIARTVRKGRARTRLRSIPVERITEADVAADDADN